MFSLLCPDFIMYEIRTPPVLVSWKLRSYSGKQSSGSRKPLVRQEGASPISLERKDLFYINGVPRISIDLYHESFTKHRNRTGLTTDTNPET